jgi:hypothetical protein
MIPATVFFVMTAVCPQVQIVNSTSTWNEIDTKNYTAAKGACSRQFTDAPCLMTFIKTEENVYKATCGEALENHSL